MKILMTGFTTRMGGDASKNFYLSTSFLLKEVLTKHLGHEVDHRRVAPGEDLDKYDLVLLGICPSGSFAARAPYVTGAAWAFEKCSQATLLFCEDWQIEEVGTDFRSTLRRWPKHAEFKKYPPSEENRVQAMLTSILVQPWPVLATFFPWGNHYLLLNNNLPAACSSGILHPSATFLRRRRLANVKSAGPTQPSKIMIRGSPSSGYLGPSVATSRAVTFPRNSC